LDNLTLKRFSQLIDTGQEKLIIGGLTGIEKENLRLSQAGFIAQTPHPENFGAALTHASITTDYSEALMEFITPPFSQTTDSLNYLNKIHQFVYDHLPDEFLLAASMPCGIDGDKSIPIAQYGTSNIGQMKHIYRQGLGHRYGRTMQAIAGIQNQNILIFCPELFYLCGPTGHSTDFGPSPTWVQITPRIIGVHHSQRNGPRGG